MLWVAGAIQRGDPTSEAKPKRKRKLRKRRKQQQCAGADNCATPENPCKAATCRRHTCRVRNRPNGASCGGESLCRDGACEVPCDGVCAGDRICRDEACVCPESGECAITSAQLDGWSISDAEKVSFVAGPGAPPLGTGSVRLSTVDNSGSAIGIDRYEGERIAEIVALQFATYVENGSGAEAGAPTLELHVLFNDGVAFTTLVLDPANTANDLVLPDVWQPWDALSADARWTVEDIPGCDEGCLMPWAEVLAAFPNATIVGPVSIRSGIGASDATGHLDALRINDLTYNFEPDAP